MVKGIGPVYAKKLVKKFNEGIFDIIETAFSAPESCPDHALEKPKPSMACWFDPMLMVQAA